MAHCALGGISVRACVVLIGIRLELRFFLSLGPQVHKERERLPHLQLLIDGQVVPKCNLLGVDFVLQCNGLPGVFGGDFVRDFFTHLLR